MQAGGIGAIGGITGGIGMGASAAPSTPISSPVSTQGLDAVNHAAQFKNIHGPHALAEALKDFSSAEILIALMLMAAANKSDDDTERSGNNGLAFLAGFALANALNQNAAIADFVTNLNSVSPIDTGGMTGGFIDVSV